VSIDIDILRVTINDLMTDGKGILALDESATTATRRLSAIGVEPSEENRRRYRELFLCTVGIEKYLSGVILYDETMWQGDTRGLPFPKVLSRAGVRVGIKVDAGLVDLGGFPNEKVTEGLDGLRDRLIKYRQSGASFAKWRAAFTIDESAGLPTEQCVQINAVMMARYARICQEEGIVPIVEPEVILEGPHSLATAETVTGRVVKALFDELVRYRVDLSGVILKTSMVVPGHGSPEHAKGWKTTVEAVAAATARMLLASVPTEVGGVVFLSGGQEPEEATCHLDAIAKHEPFPWPVAFSFARAIQEPPLSIWAGSDDNLSRAREEFMNLLEANSQADQGEYDWQSHVDQSHV
jgi:fructose-bisphosphate aldolase class I